MSKHIVHMKKVISHIEDTEDYHLFNDFEKQQIEKVIKRHPMRIPKYYYHLIDWDDANDPVKKMAIPQADELNDFGEYDTSGELSNTKLPGLQHKYQTTVLVLSTNVCFMYCRHCFRKRLVGYSKEEIMHRMRETISYVKNHKEVNNVLITGGDSLTMTNHMIERYLKNLSKIDHLDFIRFGTRSLVVQPDRIYNDQELIQLFKTYNEKKEIVIVTQFNHPNEITEEAKKAALALQNAGCTIRNQAVLLKGVNDNPNVLARLMNQLTSIGIHPYYLFQCRPVKGGTHFQLPLSKGIDIVNQVRTSLNGLSKAFRFIMSHPRGKIEIFDKNNQKFIFKFHQNKFIEDENKLFMRHINDHSKWLDYDLNLIT